MKAEGLLRLYPRSWRERYGEELLAVAGKAPLSVQQIVDIVSGAIDAWLSADVRRATAAREAVAEGGGQKMARSWMVCEKNPRYTTRDGLIGAGVMLGSALVLAVVGVVAGRNGCKVTGEILKSLSYSGSLLISAPFWLMKGQPWKAQAAIIGITLVALVAIGYAATLI